RPSCFTNLLNRSRPALFCPCTARTAPPPASGLRAGAFPPCFPPIFFAPGLAITAASSVSSGGRKQGYGETHGANARKNRLGAACGHRGGGAGRDRHPAG